MINNLGTPSSKVQINFGVLQIDTENSATGVLVTKELLQLTMSIKSLGYELKIEQT